LCLCDIFIWPSKLIRCLLDYSTYRNSLEFKRTWQRSIQALF
jgi:hypothetical protein